MGFIRAMERRWKAKDAMSGAFSTGDSALASFWFTQAVKVLLELRVVGVDDLGEDGRGGLVGLVDDVDWVLLRPMDS